MDFPKINVISFMFRFKITRKKQMLIQFLVLLKKLTNYGKWYLYDTHYNLNKMCRVVFEKLGITKIGTTYT